MTRRVHRIDWKKEFHLLEPMMRAGGGIARINHAGDVCAWQQFDLRLKQTFADLRGAMSIRIDAHWHTTRFLADILDEFDRKLDAVGLSRAVLAQAAGGAIRVLSDNRFGGDADVRIDSLHVHGPSAAQQTAERNARVASICERLGVVLDRGDRVMVVIHHGTHAEQASFWRDFWHRGLHDMVARGMFFVYYVEEDHAVYDVPMPDVTIDLPRGFSDDDREGDAYDDLIDLMESEGAGRSMAAGLALGHLNSNKASMSAFYNNLMPLIVKVRTSLAARAD